MTLFQRKRIKQIEDELKEVNRAADEFADKKLGKLQESKWTAAWLVLLAVGLAALFCALLYSVA